MCFITNQFKMDNTCSKQVPLIRPAPIGDSNSNIAATILDHATDQSQEIELLQLYPQKMKSELSELSGLLQPNEPLPGHRPLLAADVVDGDHSGVQEDSKLDKGSASEFIDQCIVDHKIQTSVITPMDRVIIAQTLLNPHPDYQEEIITVQIVYQNLKIDDGAIQKEKRPQCLTKIFKHPLEMHNSHDSKFKFCKLCEKSIEKMEKHYNCTNKACQQVDDEKIGNGNYFKDEFFRVNRCICCAKCMLSFELRRQLQDKTMLHNLVKLYHLDETDDEQEKVDQILNLIEDTKDQEPQNIPQKLKHAIIGLWRRNNSGYNECYRQFRIDSPVTQKRFLGSELQIDCYAMLEPLFYVGDKGGLFYFTQTQTLDNLGAKKKEFYLQQFDLAQACSIKIDSIKLRPYYRNMYYPPIIGGKQAVGKDVDNLLESVFFQRKVLKKQSEIMTTQSPFEPQFFESAGYLVLTVDKAVPFNDISSNNLFDTEYTNIFFCRLDQPSKIDKVIYNGCVVLKINVTSNKITDVWYSCDKNLNQISWKNEIDPSQLTREFLKEKSPQQKLASCYAFSGRTDYEDLDVKNNLHFFFCIKSSCYQVKGVMHNNDQRVSFVFTNCDFITFEINKVTNKAVLVQGNEQKGTDSQFCFSKDGSLSICFNLQHKKAKEKQLYSIKIDFINLDDKKPDQSSNEVDSDDRRREFKIEFKIGPHLKIKTFDRNDKGHLPYQFTDFRTFFKDGKQEFMVSLHFLDSETNQPNLYFLKGKKIGQGDNEECVSQPFVRKQFTTEYPILIQNTYLPLQNQLLVANLSLNEPQKQIDLGDYRFICFVETGLQSFATDFFGKGDAANIFFLALSPNGHIKLMKFKAFPWLIPERDNDCIIIYSGFILVTKLTQPTKIKGAALLYNGKGFYDDDLLVKIVIQSYEDIQVYSLSDPKYLKQLKQTQSQLEERITELHLVCNQNLIFYVKRYDGRTVEKIICVHHRGPDIAEEVAYTSSFQILQIQAKQDDVPIENEQTLYIIDSQSRFIEIKCNMKNLTFEVVRSVKMNKAEQIINKLKGQKWQKLALSSRSVTASLTQEAENQGILKGAITYNLSSGNIFKHDFLGYNADAEITNTETRRKNKIQTNCQVLSVQHLAGIGKILLTVQEGNFCYYHLMQSLDNRRIELFSHQPNTNPSLSGIRFQGSKINAYIFPKQDFIFGLNDLMQKQTQLFAFNKGLACFGPNIYNYFFLKKRVQKGTNETQVVDMILRYNPDGGLTTIYSSFIDLIGKLRIAIDYQFKTEFKGEVGSEERCRDPDQIPAFTVTSKGTLVLPFHLAQSKKVESFTEEKCTFKIVKYNLPYENENLETLNEGINDPTEDEKKVVIYVIKNDTFKTSFGLKQTAHFLIITGYHKIFFKKLALINNPKQKADLESTQKNQATSLQESLSADKIGEFNNFQGITTLIESKECCYKFECIDLSQMFTEMPQQFGYRLRVIMSDKQIDNVIQIQNKNLVLLWDLEKNQELNQITNFGQFVTPETMIPSPFQLIEQTNDKNSYLFNDMYFLDLKNYITNLSASYSNFLVKMYTMLDLIEMQAIHQILKKQSFKNSTPIDPESVLAFFHGKNFFQLFQKNPEVIDSFLKQLKEKNLPKFISEHGVESDNIYVRRLFRILKAQITAEDSDEVSLIFKRYQQKVFEPPKQSGLTIFQQQLKESDSNFILLDTLLEIVLLSSEVEISILITDFQHLKKVIGIQSIWVSAFMQKVFKTNVKTEEVYNMPWDKKNKIVVFTANNSQLTSEEIKKKAQERMITQTKVSYLHARIIKLINRYTKCKNLEPPALKFNIVSVTVKMIEISWLTREELKDFYLFVSCSNSETLYDMELIRVLLTSQDYGMQLIYRVFLPYMILMGAVLYYFGVCVNAPHIEGFFGGEAVGLRCFIFAYQLFFCGIEVKQMHNLKGYYWTDPWNFVYLLQYALTYLVIIEHSTSWFGLDHSQLTQFTACTTILLWTILFYWMRIFNDLGFYVYLITETLKDTKSFLILVLIVLITFANALYILEIANNPSAALSDDTALTLTIEDGASEIKPLIQIAYNVTFIDSVVNQYLLGLGEFQYEPFASSPSGPLIWSLFLFSTFLTQVTFMNMLIAIMSNTFSRVLENQERYGLQQKTMITADFIYALSLSEMITEKRFLYIIEPVNTSKSQDAIESSIENLKKSLASENTKHSQLIREETNKVTSGILTQVQLISKQMTNFSQVLNDQSGEQTLRDYSTVSKRPTLPRQRFSQGKGPKGEASQEKIGMDAKIEEMSDKVKNLTTNMDAMREEISSKVETLTKNADAQAKQMSAIHELLQQLINQRLN